MAVKLNLILIFTCALLLNFSVANDVKAEPDKHIQTDPEKRIDAEPKKHIQVEPEKHTEAEPEKHVPADESTKNNVTVEDKSTSETTPITTTTVTDAGPTKNVTTSAPITIEPKTSDAPIPTTKPPVFDGWNVTDHGVTCIKLLADIEIKIPYTQKNNHTNVSNITVPHDATSTGSCNTSGGQMIQLKWLNIDTPTDAAWSILTMLFEKNDKEHTFSLFSINATIPIDDKHFPDIKGNSTKPFEFFGKHLKAFSSPLNMSYVCKKESEVSLSTSNNATSTVKFVDVQLQAFKASKGAGFDKAVNCEVAVTPDIVPIIVGCTLALLVIVVLIAYLIGRKRAQARGYFSM